MRKRCLSQISNSRFNRSNNSSRFSVLTIVFLFLKRLEQLMNLHNRRQYQSSDRPIGVSVGRPSEHGTTRSDDRNENGSTNRYPLLASNHPSENQKGKLPPFPHKPVGPLDELFESPCLSIAYTTYAYWINHITCSLYATNIRFYSLSNASKREFRLLNSGMKAFIAWTIGMIWTVLASSTSWSTCAATSA